MKLSFTVKKTAPTLYLYLVPEESRHHIPGRQHQETRAEIRRLGDLPSRNARLVATHEIGTDVISTEEASPFSSEDLVRLFSSWYDYRSIPAGPDVDLADPRQRLVEADYYQKEHSSLARMSDWRTPFSAAL